MTAKPFDTKAEVDLWNALIQAQQSYAQSLASLDALVFDDTDRDPPSLERQLIEEAAKVRRAAYIRYQQAMGQMSGYLRR